MLSTSRIRSQKETVYTPAFRQRDPTFPAYLQGLVAFRKIKVVQSTMAFASVPQVPSALCPGATHLHPLCYKVEVEVMFPCAGYPTFNKCNWNRGHTETRTILCLPMQTPRALHLPGVFSCNNHALSLTRNYPLLGALSRASLVLYHGKPHRFCLEGRCRANANPRVVLPAAFSHPPSKCDPCSFRPPLLHCCCAAA